MTLLELLILYCTEENDEEGAQNTPNPIIVTQIIIYQDGNVAEQQGGQGWNNDYDNVNEDMPYGFKDSGYKERLRKVELDDPNLNMISI
jgi:hypothetical protein